LITVNVDGGARGNPGPAALGIVARQDGKPLFEVGESLGRATNNQAEYSALCRALEEFKKRSLQRETVEILMDSELVVKQVNGAYRIKNAALKPIYERAFTLLKEFQDITVHYVPRRKNAAADKIVNKTLDNG